MIPSLPTEIIREIILFSLPPFEQTKYRERYDLLLACSLVDEVWKIIAQEELIKHLLIKDLAGLKLINKELNRKKEIGIESNVLSLRLEDNRDSKLDIKHEIISLFVCIRGVKEIWLKGFYMSEVLDKDWFDWTSLNSLDRLHLISTRLREDLDTVDDPFEAVDFALVRFPVLTHITLMDIIPNGVHEYEFISRLFQPSKFPSLISFAYFSTAEDGEFLDEEIPELFSNQIKKLLIYDVPGSLETGTLSNLHKFKKLESLVLLDIYSIQVQPTLPNSLSSLSIIRAHTPCLNQEIDQVTEWIEKIDVLKQLRKLSFPIPTDCEERLEIFKKFTSGRNIELYHDCDGGFIYTESSWEDLLDLLSEDSIK